MRIRDTPASIINRMDITRIKRKTGASYVRKRRHMLKQYPVCQSCNERLSEEMDHIIPLHLGGSDKLENLQMLCKQCHYEKTEKEMRDFRGQFPVCKHGKALQLNHDWRCEICLPD